MAGAATDGGAATDAARTVNQAAGAMASQPPPPGSLAAKWLVTRVVQWRSWPAPSGEHIDQISAALDLLRTDPDSRRIIVSAWNVGEIERMALPPCHAFFQFYVADGRLSCQLYQRSADLFLGVPFNIASYALLTHMMAAQAGLSVGEFIWAGGDCHIYDNHVEQVRLQLSREPRPYPKLLLADRDSIFEYTYEDIVVKNYDPHPAIKAPVAV